MNDVAHTDKLKSLLKQKFGKPLGSLSSIEELAVATKLSTQTLRRFLGLIEKDSGNGIGENSLSQLCRYVGFSDWEDFQENFQNENAMTAEDKSAIEHMAIFFRNGKKHGLDYFQNTITVDTLNDYAQVIYARRENVEYFYRLYRDNSWAVNYIFTWLPNNNYFGQDWFRNILRDRIEQTTTPYVRLSLSIFLCLGSFFAKNDMELNSCYQSVGTLYADYKKSYHYSAFMEMRYHSLLLIEAKSNNDREQFDHLLEKLFSDFQTEHVSEFNQQELTIFLCNTLIWMQEYRLAYELLKDMTGFITDFPAKCIKERPLHYFGINMAFVKTTFALAWAVNGLEELPQFAVSHTDFDDPTGLLYNDYIRLIYLAKSILSNNGQNHKMKLYDELKILADKTGYMRIYDVVNLVEK